MGSIAVLSVRLNLRSRKAPSDCLCGDGLWASMKQLTLAALKFGEHAIEKVLTFIKQGYEKYPFNNETISDISPFIFPNHTKSIEQMLPIIIEVSIVHLVVLNQKSPVISNITLLSWASRFYDIHSCLDWLTNVLNRYLAARSQAPTYDIRARDTSKTSLSRDLDGKNRTYPDISKSRGALTGRDWQVQRRK